MTVMLGRQAGTPPPRPSRPGFRTDECWDARRRRYHQSLVPKVYPTWQPAPTTPRQQPHQQPHQQPWTAAEPGPDRAASGMLALYARRVDRQPGPSARPRRAAPHERTLVCGGDGAGARRRSYAVIGHTQTIGRGSEAHYRSLHPRSRPAYSRLRCRASTPQPRTIVFRRAVTRRTGSIAATRSILYPLIAGAGSSPMQGMRRVVIATVAALIVLAGAATGGLAAIM